MRLRFLVALSTFALIVGCGSPAGDRSRPTDSESAPKSEASGTEEKTVAKESGSIAGLPSNELMDPPADLIERSGVEAYPGAQVLKSLPAIRDTTNDDFFDVVYFTDDNGKDVIEFYRARLSEAKVIGEEMQSTGVFVLDGKNRRGETMRVQAHTANGKTNFHVITRRSK